MFAVLRDGRPVIGVPQLAGAVWREQPSGAAFGAPSGAATGAAGDGGGGLAAAGGFDDLLVRASITEVNRPPNGLGLVLYTATYIGEIVRAGILAVAHGQTEAAYAVGLRPGPTLRLIIIPQALRVIIPPLTSQYLNLTKNSSLAGAVGYPDLVATSGTILNQTGQAVEVLFITMMVYLTLSLVTSAFMSWFNARVALVER